MATESAAGRYPAGTGWVAGFAFGLVVGLLAWLVSAQVTLGLLLLVATGPALGVAFEQALGTRPLPPRERRVARLLALAGGVVGALVLAYVALSA